jgi:hypothetical protein
MSDRTDAQRADRGTPGRRGGRRRGDLTDDIDDGTAELTPTAVPTEPPTPDVFVASDLPDSAKKLFDCADAAIAAITEFEKLLFGDDNPLPERLTTKYKPRCKSMVTELMRMSNAWARSAGTTT